MRFALLVVVVPSLAFAEPATPVATKAFMRDVANGKIKAADLVDPTTGILEVVYVDGEFDPPVTKSARRLCGKKAIDELAWVLLKQARNAVRADELFSCKNRPHPSCTVGDIGEHMTNVQYVFRPLPDGTLVVDTMIHTMSNNKPKDEARVVARLRNKHVGGTCD